VVTVKFESLYNHHCTDSVDAHAMFYLFKKKGKALTLPGYFRTIRAAAVLFCGYTVITTTIYPRFSLYGKTQITNEVKLQEIYNVTHLMGLDPKVTNKMFFITGKTTQCLGGTWSIGGGGVSFGRGMSMFLGLNDEQSMIHVPNYKDLPPMHQRHMLASVFSFKKQREAIVAHELAHYKLNHSFWSIPIFATIVVGLYILPLINPLYSTPLALGVVLTFSRVNNYKELAADEYACKMLGLEHTNAFLGGIIAEREKQTSEDRHPLLVFIRDLRTRLWHVPLNKRIHNLQIIQRELEAK